MHFSWLGFWKYSAWSVEFLFVWPMWLITSVILVHLAAALAAQWPFRVERWRKAYWLLLANFLFLPATVAIAVFGAVNPAPWESSKPNVAGEWIENGLFVASLLVGAFWIYRMKGLRWLATAVLVLQVWLLFGAGFIAGMALSGQWL